MYTRKNKKNVYSVYSRNRSIKSTKYDFNTNDRYMLLYTKQYCNHKLYRLKLHLRHMHKTSLRVHIENFDNKFITGKN